MECNNLGGIVMKNALPTHLFLFPALHPLNIKTANSVDYAHILQRHWLGRKFSNIRVQAWRMENWKSEALSIHTRYGSCKCLQYCRKWCFLFLRDPRGRLGCLTSRSRSPVLEKVENKKQMVNKRRLTPVAGEGFDVCREINPQKAREKSKLQQITIDQSLRRFHTH